MSNYAALFCWLWLFAVAVHGQQVSRPVLIIVEEDTQRPVMATVYLQPWRDRTKHQPIGHSGPNGEALLDVNPDLGDFLFIESEANDPHIIKPVQWRPPDMRIVLEKPRTRLTTVLVASLGEAKRDNDFAKVALIANDLSTQGDRSTRIAYDTEHKFAAAKAIGIPPEQALTYNQEKNRLQFSETFDARVKKLKVEEDLPNRTSKLDSAALSNLAWTTIGQIIATKPGVN